MSFQPYPDHIQAVMAKSPAYFRRLAMDKGFAEGGKLKAGGRGRVVGDDKTRGATQGSGTARDDATTYLKRA